MRRDSIPFALGLLVCLLFASQVRPQDLNGDGQVDIVFGNIFNTNRTCLGNGTGGFACSDIDSVERVSGDPGLADFNGDGHLDVVFPAIQNGFNQICLGHGTGGFSCSDISEAPHWAFQVAVGDIDEDGILDLVFPNRNFPNQVCFGDGSGGFACADVDSFSSVDTRAVAVGDITGDGHLDAVFANPQGSSRLCVGDGTGAFSCSLIDSQPAGSSVRLGDVDLDGDLDAVFASQVSPNPVCLNDGAGGFTCSWVNTVNRESIGVELADVDEDGNLDAIFANLRDPDQICLGVGLGAFVCSDLSPAIDRTGSGGSIAVEAQDVNGDCTVDLVFARSEGNDGALNEICLGDGWGDFTCATMNRHLANSFGVAITSGTSCTEQECALVAHDDLVSWWRGEGDAVDTSGSSDGSLEGGVGFASGLVGEAFDFTSGMVRIPDSTDLRPQELTIETWIHPDAYFGDSIGPIIVSKDLVGGATISYDLVGPNNVGQYWASVGLTTGGSATIQSTNTFAINTWHHVAMTWDGSTVELFVDGHSQGTTTVAPSTIAYDTTDVGIGRHPLHGTRPFNGLIDEVGFYDRALSGVEILSIAQAGSAGKCCGDSDGDSVDDCSDNCPTIPNPSQADQDADGEGDVCEPLCAPILEQLTSWWPGENDALDFQGTSDGTAEGAVSFAPGLVGQAFDFSLGMVRVADGPEVSPQEMTIEAWVNPRSAGSTPDAAGAIIVSKDSTHYPGAISYDLVGPGSTGLFLASVCFTDGSCQGVGTSTPVGFNEWHHVAMTWDGSSLDIFLDGQSEHLVTVGPRTIQYTNIDVGIGRHPLHVGRHFDGLIDEVGFYSRALSASEIQAIYEAESAGKCTEEPCIDNDGDGYGLLGSPTCLVAGVDCDDSDDQTNPGASEICDGKDNDCNFLVDDFEGLGASCSTGAPGVCSEGTFECVPPDLGCVSLVDPLSETCDGLDNDCDGLTDEDFDADGDGTADCFDGCPADPAKIAPGVCGCGVADLDTDGDGVLDCLDNCTAVANPGQEDFNGDLVGDACQDTDGDGLSDEAEITAAGGSNSCPSPISADSDGDSLPDGADPFPCDVPPTADAGTDQAIRSGDVVGLDGTGSFDDNTDTESLVYSWSFSSLPAGSSASLDDPSSATPSFVADVADTYVVELVVTDGVGQSSPPDYVVVSSDNLPPTAAAGNDVLVITGETVSLDGSGSTDPENDPLTYSWAITTSPLGSTAVLVDADTAAPSLTPDVDGLYVLTLVVSDLIGPGVPDTVEITSASAEEVSEILIVETGEIVTQLDPGEVTTGGNQNALTNFLSQAAQALQEGDITEAIQKLEKAISRADGCALRGSPDANGSGRDWITDCTEQLVVYQALNDALAALLP